MALWFEENWDNETRYSLHVTETLFDQKSPLQHIQVIDTPAYGRVLIIDGLLMTSERDEHYYHEMLVHPTLVSAPSIERVLIIGGGDGGTAREVLRHEGVEQVVMVEIDAMVIEACKEHMPKLGSWDDPRLDLHIADGIEFVAEAAAGSFDVVLLDGTDPVGPGEGLFGVEFYRNVQRVLRDRGVFALQSESPFYLHKIFMEIQTALRGIFDQVTPYFGSVPLYACGLWSWTHACKSGDPRAIDLARLETIESGCKYYNRDIHAASFAMPNELRAKLGAPDWTRR